MERLTDRSKEIPLPCADNALFWARVHEKLARYEDSGLEPEEIKRSDALLRGFIDLSRRHARTLSWIEKVMIADREGRLLVLPCKVGDTVWFNTYKNNATECVGIQPHEVKRVNVCFLTDGAEIPQWEIGKTVFPTREDAEKALEVANND